MAEVGEGMTLLEFSRVIKKNLKVIVALTVAGVLLAAAYAWGVVHLQYSVTATMNVPSKAANVSAYLTASDAKAAAESATGITNMSSYKISSEVVTATSGVTVTVSGPDATKAARIANQLTVSTIEAAKQRLDVEVIVVSAADATHAKVSPNRTMILAAGLFGGLFAALCIVLLREALRSSFASPKELEDKLGIPTLAVLPKEGKGSGSEGSHTGENSKQTAGMKQLADNVSFYCDNNEHSSIALVSAGRNDDQALVSAELAVALADLGRHTILVDADMSRSPAAALLPATDASEKPLSAYLHAKADLKDIIGHSGTSGVDLVCADKDIPNASLVYSSTLFKTLVQGLGQTYDVVLVNVPLDMADDTIAVAALADATLLVTANGGSHYREVIDLYRELSGAGVNVIGSVLTRVKKLK